MSLFLYETKENLPSTITNGDVYYTDNGDIYIDKDSKRYKMNLNSLPVTLQNLTQSLTEIKEETSEPDPDPEPPVTDNTYTFAFLADTHESRYASQLVSSIESKNVPLLAHAGDYVNYGSSSLLKTQVNNYSGNYTYLVARGNHDGTATSGYNSFLTESQVVSAMGSPYYYRDITDKKIRFIVLNTEDRDLTTVASDPQHYYGIGVAQMKWLCGTALQVSEPGWSAILLMHTPLCPLESMNGWSYIQYSERTSGYGRWYIASKVISACNNATTLTTAYTEGPANATMNYTFNGNMTIIAALCGHVHADNIVKVNGVPNVSIQAVVNTPCYDLVTVDKDNKKLTFNRYNVNGELTSSRETTWGTPDGNNVGTAEAHTNSSSSPSDSSGSSSTTTPAAGTYSFNAIAFEDGVLRYIAENRGAAAKGSYLVENLDLCKTVTIQSGKGVVTFAYGKANVSEMITQAVDGKQYAVFFSGGRYVGYNDNTKATSYSNAATNRIGDFFGVPQQTITIET